jgi:hypothetical protein
MVELTCGCGVVVSGRKALELIQAFQAHALDAHGLLVPAGSVVRMASKGRDDGTTADG